MSPSPFAAFYPAAVRFARDAPPPPSSGMVTAQVPDGRGFPNGMPQLLDHRGVPFPKGASVGSAEASGVALPYGLTFLGRYRGGSHTFWHDRWDEALRHAREDAQAMVRDCWLMSLVEERIRAVSGMSWHLETPDDHDRTQKRVKEGITRILKGVYGLRRVVNYLLWAIWYGRYAVEVQWAFQPFLDGVEQELRPAKGLTVRRFWPIMGDKIGHQEDDTPYVLVNGTMRSYVSTDGSGKTHWNGEPTEFIQTTSGGTGLRLGTPWWREQFLIHENLGQDRDYFQGDQAEAVHGVGVRSVVFWMNWLKMEWLANITDYFDRVGLGITIWKFPRGNDNALAAVKAAALGQSNRAHIFVPVDPEGGKSAGSAVERLEVPTSGADALVKLVEYVDAAIERYVIGQEASSRGVQGNEQAALMQKSTKQQIAAQDAVLLAESLTGNHDQPSLVNTIQKHTYPWADFPVHWVFDVERGEGKDRLAAAKQCIEMGLSIKADELRSSAGFSRPVKGDEVVQAQKQGYSEGIAGQPPPGQQPGAGGQEGAPPPGGENPRQPGSPPDGDFLDVFRQQTAGASG